MNNYVVTEYCKKELKETLIASGMTRQTAHSFREKLNHHANKYNSGVRYKCYPASDAQLEELSKR